MIWALILGGIGGLLASGLFALIPRHGRLSATLALAVSAAAVAAGAALALADPAGAALTVDWSLPLGRFAVAVDPLSALFLVPVLLVPVLGVVYGHGYLEADPAWSAAARVRVRVFYGLLTGSLALIVVARDGVLFLLAWEGMALTSFFLVTSDDRDASTRAAGWTYLIATHVGTLALIAYFVLLAVSHGGTALTPLDPATAPPVTALFALALVGFGMKAGLMPLHVWLPPAHAAAPTHVSAVLSGVVTKMGIYGLVRTLELLPSPPVGHGLALLVVGAISAIGGLAFALGQSDVKRLLAYSTIENLGVIALGLGLALIGRSLGEPVLVALGLGGALLHVLAHSLMKPLLFYAAGSLIHGAGSRNLERMGGLAKAMPQTAALFAVGAVAICALPPLSGFASELVIYLGAFAAIEAAPAAALVAPVLAMTGALALACFVRAFGVAFLGEPRAPLAHPPHEAARTMRVPMFVLVALIAALGLLPWLVTPLVDRATAAVTPGATPALASLIPLGWVTGVGAALLALGAVVYFALARHVGKTSDRTAPTWDCGYARSSARVQYTASSFSASLLRYFPWLVRPRDTRPALEGPFPQPARFEREVPDVVLDQLLVPALRRASGRLAAARFMREARLQTYILFVLLALVALFIGLSL